MIKKSLFILVIGIFLSSIPVFCQKITGRGQLTGVIYDAQTKAPLEGVTVKLFYVKAQKYKTPHAKSDAEGKWKGLYLKGGMWYVDFEKVGYEPKKSSINIVDSPGIKSPNMKIFLRKLQGPVLNKNVVDDINATKELVTRGKYKQAISKFQDMLNEYKESKGIGIVNLYIGNCYVSLSDFEKAITYFKAALKNYPEHKGIINSIGEAYMNIKKQKEAMEWFSKLDISEIRNPDSLYNLGVVNANKAIYDQAEQYFKKAIEVKPDFSEAYYQLGMAYVALNKTKPALENLNKFLEMAPDSKNAAIAQSIIDAYKDQ